MCTCHDRVQPDTIQHDTIPLSIDVVQCSFLILSIISASDQELLPDTDIQNDNDNLATTTSKSKQ